MITPHSTTNAIPSRTIRRDGTPGGMHVGGESRRRFERVPFFCKVQLTAHAEHLSVEAHTCDLSLGGVKVAAPVALPTGSNVSLDFSLADKAGDKTIENVDGRVMRCDADVEANYLGIEFTRPLSAVGTPHLFQRLMNA
ncbi:MAG TPA: PilZ domain-containing protein [Pirellulales bacterium]|jgi:c-di-GMP-binding flagellar brake protein YcgR|nr:PilZ domain-containing protein [Pirellulales bacterium]